MSPTWRLHDVLTSPVRNQIQSRARLASQQDIAELALIAQLPCNDDEPSLNLYINMAAAAKITREADWTPTIVTNYSHLTFVYPDTNDKRSGLNDDGTEDRYWARVFAVVFQCAKGSVNIQAPCKPCHACPWYKEFHSCRLVVSEGIVSCADCLIHGLRCNHKNASYLGLGIGTLLRLG